MQTLTFAAGVVVRTGVSRSSVCAAASPRRTIPLRCVAHREGDRKRGNRSQQSSQSSESVPRLEKHPERQRQPALRQNKKRDKRQQRAQAVKERPDARGFAGSAPCAEEDIGGGIMPQGVLNCIVKIYATHTQPNYSMPWALERQTQSTSSGFVIEGRRIITCAHCIEHASIVLVRRRGTDVKYAAKVQHIGSHCDVALLVVEDPTFWDEAETVAKKLKSSPYLVPGPVPELQNECAVVGFSTPGESICITAGVVSRVEMQVYAHSSATLLAVQVDSPINGGSSGGPVFDEECRVVGIAFQSCDPGELDSVGYIVPYVVVQHFLDDVANNSKYMSFPELGFTFQKLENASMRAALGLPEDERNGILVKAVHAVSDASRILKAG
jgi:S1-C subfamily serine protease